MKKKISHCTYNEAGNHPLHDLQKSLITTNATAINRCHSNGFWILISFHAYFMWCAIWKFVILKTRCTPASKWWLCCRQSPVWLQWCTTKIKFATWLTVSRQSLINVMALNWLIIDRLKPLFIQNSLFRCEKIIGSLLQSSQSYFGEIFFVSVCSCRGRLYHFVVYVRGNDVCILLEARWIRRVQKSIFAIQNKVEAHPIFRHG